MPYAIVRDTPATWEDYRVVNAADLPRGLLLRFAGPTPEGIREIELWRRRRDLERFEAEPRPVGPCEPVVRLLVVRHVVDTRTAVPTTDRREIR